MTRPNTLGSGQVWSDLSKPIVHFGSPAQPPSTPLVGQDGRPIR